MGDAPDPPPAPDPVKTANAQTNQNIASAVGSQMINMVNQNTPQGTLNYSQTGSNSYKMQDANGVWHTYEIPQFTATQTYSPDQQKLYDLSNQTKQTVAQIGVDQSKRMGDLLNTPLDLSDTTIDKHLYDLYSPRINDQQGRANSALQAQLAAQGVTAGSEAYNNAINLQNQGFNDQWNQMLLNGRQQAVQQLVTQRQEPINELNALMSGSQVTNPTYGQTPSTQIRPADYEGDVYNSYNAQLGAYNAQNQANAATMGGIFGTIGNIAGMGLGGWLRSDMRLKRNIKRLGTLRNGIAFHAYEIDGAREIGLLAQEVERVKPWAVRELGGVKHVNYEQAVH